MSKYGTCKIFWSLKYDCVVYGGDSKHLINETDAKFWRRLGPEGHEGNYVEVEYPECKSVLFHCLLSDYNVVKEVRNKQGKIKIPPNMGTSSYTFGHFIITL